MSASYICVAGFDETGGRWRRPLLRTARLTASALVSRGGLFDLGVIVDLGVVAPAPTPPEAEDCHFLMHRALKVRRSDPAAFWAGLARRRRGQLSDVFGRDLVRDGRTCVVAVGRGHASLGCLGPVRVAISSDRFQNILRVRVQLTDEELGDLSLPLTDLRCFRDGIPDEAAIEGLARRVGRAPVLLSVGLSRAYQPPGRVPSHWLQVNNVHLAHDPLWGTPVDG